LPPITEQLPDNRMITTASRDEIEAGVLFTGNCSIISIVCSDDVLADFSRLRNVKVLSLSFDDFERPVHEGGATWCWLGNRQPVLFDSTFAKAIDRFVFGHVWQHLVVHCYAGVSRSTAVAAAVAQKLGGSGRRWLVERSPNNLVFQTLKDYWNG